MGKSGRNYFNVPLHRLIRILKGLQSKETVQVGMAGVLVTCFRNAEAKCTNELYYLLSRAQEQLEEEKEEQEQKVDEENDETAKEAVCFADQISAEVGGLKKRSSKQFIALDTKGLQCLVFARALPSTPLLPTIDRLFSMIRTRALPSLKFCQRVLPVEVICMARMEDIRVEASRLVREKFRVEEPTDYCVAFESRLNDSLDRMTVIDMLAAIVGPVHKVNLSKPKKVILVTVFKSHCGLSILDGWVENRKYNVQEVLKATMAANN